MYNHRKEVMESAATKLFERSDHENKGFIVKRDMQRMKDEIALTSEQLEIVFDTLDMEKNGYLTIDQFLEGFRQYSITSSEEIDDIPGYVDKQVIEDDYRDELTIILDLLKGTNILETSADELEYISEQMRRKADGSHLSRWQLFLKDLYHDLLTYKNAQEELEKLMKQKEKKHENYIRKMFDEVETELKDQRDKEIINEQIKIRMNKEIKILKAELNVKDELLQQSYNECKKLKNQLILAQKKEEKTSSINDELLHQQDSYEAALETERAKRDHVQTLLENVRRRFSIEKSQCFKDGFNLARKVIRIQEEGLLQQLQLLEGMQKILENKQSFEIKDDTG